MVYKWGSEAVDLDSNDFMTFADCSTGGACLPDVKRLGGKFDSLFIVFVCLFHPEVNKSLQLLRPIASVRTVTVQTNVRYYYAL